MMLFRKEFHLICKEHLKKALLPITPFGVVSGSDPMPTEGKGKRPVNFKNFELDLNDSIR